MAVPQRRTSTMRKNTRRSHDALAQPTIINCKNCGSVVLSHRACMKCKTYRGISIDKSIFDQTDAKVLTTIAKTKDEKTANENATTNTKS